MYSSLVCFIIVRAWVRVIGLFLTKNIPTLYQFLAFCCLSKLLILCMQKLTGVLQNPTESEFLAHILSTIISNPHSAHR